MVFQPCMLEQNAPRVTTMSLMADGHAILVTWTLRAWALVDAVTHGGIEFWDNGLERREDRVTLRIPVTHSGSMEWRNTLIALAALRQAVEALHSVDLSELRGDGGVQLAWIDALLLRFRATDIALVASPVFAAFIRCGSPEMFRRVSSAMLRAERTVKGGNHIPLTHGASCHNGTLHLLVGDDCACVGVSSMDIPQTDASGWVAHGHNLDTAHRMLLVLVALAALEDECRAASGN